MYICIVVVDNSARGGENEQKPTLRASQGTPSFEGCPLLFFTNLQNCRGWKNIVFRLIGFRFAATVP